MFVLILWVVDTGIHHMGWSKEKAAEFLRENTAFSDTYIDLQVTK